MDLYESRQKIDEIDRQIVELFENRMKVSVEVAKYKKKTGKKIYDKQREEQVLDKLSGLVEGEFNKQGIRELYKQIMSISRKLQYGLLNEGQDCNHFTEVDTLDTAGKKIVFFGEHGAYTEQAMLEFFGDDIDSYSVPTFKAVMEELKAGNAEYGVLPIENSSTGGITDCFDLLMDYENYIVGEHEIKIDQCLLGISGANIEELKTVFSHQQGLMQCAEFLEQYPGIEQVPYKSTATSARKVMEDGDVHQAAIASRRAAQYYGLEILKENINFESTNTTRFIIISRKKEYVKDSNKISICFSLPHECGSLYNMLSNFIYNNLNMTKIESRPIEGRKWEYRFFIEVEGNLRDPGVQNALYGIAEEASICRVLGNFRTF